MKQNTTIFQPVQMNVNQVIGNLDRLLSEFLALTELKTLDVIDAQTLKHHADDLIGVGQKALETIEQRTRQTIEAVDTKLIPRQRSTHEI